MFKSYWTMAWRTLVRNKIYTLVNVLGLALGICACLVIWVIVRYEFSFDRNHPGGSRIYRVNTYEQFIKNEPERLVPAVLADLPEAIRKEVPGVETVAPYHILAHDTATVTGVGKQEANYPATPIAAGPEYFRIMAYEWLAGDEHSALVYPFSVVLTESRARQYFGTGPLNGLIGREIVYQDSLHVHVSGIVRDWSEHTDFPYTDFISLSTVDHSFLLQSLGLDPSRANKTTAMEAVLLQLAPKADPDHIRTVLSALYERQGRTKSIFPRIELQPLSSVHFTSVGGDSAISTSQLSVLYALLSIALFILVLAMINYVNLATAQSLTREKEISIRKVIGSGRLHLIVQLLSETFLLTALAGFMALLLAAPVLHVFQQFIPPGLRFSPFAPVNLLFLLGITLFITLLAGLYPARLLSFHSPVAALKGAGAPRGGEKWWLRKGLIVFQFTISLLFIIGTMVIGRQISFMLHKDLGFRSDAIVTFNTDERKDSVGKARLLEETIRQVPGVADVARENMPPMGSDRGIFTIRLRANSTERLIVEAITADEHYIQLYGIRLLAGKNLFPSDTLKEVVINESLSKALGFGSPDQAIGKQIYTWNKYVPIVGVVADFHKYSYRAPIQPLLIAGIACTDIAVRLDTKGRSAGEVRAILTRIGRQWKAFYPHRPFEFSFFDDEIAQLYRREQTMEWLMDIATGITLLISCIGLFGLTLFTTERRTREIGIRKVMGARVTDILTLLGKDLVLLMLIALVIASAGGWYGMHWWLQDYAYRVRIGADVFLLAGAALLLVTVLTVGAQSLKAALVNPIKSLRTE
ncbi:ABC transporter permease [Flavitalea sp. BT771]|uniref:ABC transporter permease n=1 Tax=Flavitalea sp. BT771 TaxID=3063329 RepID=UPI0026E2BB1B|nr:ABC transporter permease [Flavitalea sp. BT771]MDO6433447.1 ABC transporter permease [Flavitalea sp. BT771]MDV6222648.1 ABC transporter permease [Flavitalea sp. BT771]